MNHRYSRLGVAACLFFSGTCAAAEFLTFEFTEHPSRSSDGGPYRIALQVQEDGAYQASWAYLDEQTSAPVIEPQQGSLTVEELQSLRVACTGIDLISDKLASYDIGYSSKPEPGWKGSIKIACDGQQRGAQFTSMRSSSPGERNPALNRLVTFVFDLKNLTRDKLHSPVVRAKPAD